MSSSQNTPNTEEPCCSKTLKNIDITSTFKELQEKQKRISNSAFAQNRQFYGQQTQRNIDTSHLKFDKDVFLGETDYLPRTTLYHKTRKNVQGEKTNNWDCVPHKNDNVTISDLFPEYENDVPDKVGEDIDENMLEELLVKVGNGKFESNLFENVCDALSLPISPEKLHKKFAATYPDYHKTVQDNENWEKSLERHQKHFCRRCFTYGCLLHKEESKFVKNPHQLFSGKPEIETPCGDDCYVLKTDVNNNDTFAKDWTESDKSFCRLLRKTFLDNYCAIALSIPDKSCREVYELLVKNKEIEENEHLKEAGDAEEEQKKQKAKKSRKSKVLAKQSHIKKEIQETLHYKPCECKGDCKEDCPCEVDKNLCEKFCLCSHVKCKNRFAPCNCKAQCDTNKCPCFLAFRECDPDVCNCKIKVENDGLTCKNVQLQRGLKKHLLLAKSDVAGWGIFAKNDIKKDEFISEYLGEKITQDESERRGKVYDFVGHSFLFDLSRDFALDATFTGNKIRFANHSSQPNCYCKSLMVLGDKRIGIYAKKNILAGEELFFDYGYDPTDYGNQTK